MGLRLQIVSDLHLSQWGSSYGFGWFQTFLDDIRTDADVLVLAGDIVNLSIQHKLWSVARLNEFAARYKHVLFVPGNHEYDGTSIPDGLERLIEASAMIPGLQVLHSDRVVEIAGQRFLGDTMWQPSLAEDEEAGVITDHYRITDFQPDAPFRFRLFEDFLSRELREGDVVVTHHAPSLQSLDVQWVDDPCNRWFLTPEIEPLLLDRRPRLWIHGHVHSHWDYQLGSTRVIANPLGYPGEGVKFNPKMIVELP